MKKVDPLPHSTPISEDKVRFVCVSDTHGRTNKMTPESMPPGDVLLHGGDFSDVGQPKQIYKFNEWLGKNIEFCLSSLFLPYYYKVLLHAGDFSDVGQPKQIYKFNEWLGKVSEFRILLIQYSLLLQYFATKPFKSLTVVSSGDLQIQGMARLGVYNFEICLSSIFLPL